MSEQSGSVRSVASALSHTLGWERSVEVVADAARRLGLVDGSIGAEERQAILEDLALEPGLVGVTARYTLSRGAISRGDAPPSSSSPSSPRYAPPLSIAPDSSAAALLVATLGVHEVVASLSALMGQDKGEPAVLGALKRLGLPRERLDREQATRLLDELCRQEGHVGTTARFVRSRVMAKFGA